MPRYEYRCKKCNKLFTKVEPITAHGRKRVSCPKCKAASAEQIFGPFYAKTVKKS